MGIRRPQFEDRRQSRERRCEDVLTVAQGRPVGEFTEEFAEQEMQIPLKPAESCSCRDALAKVQTYIMNRIVSIERNDFNVWVLGGVPEAVRLDGRANQCSADGHAARPGDGLPRHPRHLRF